MVSFGVWFGFRFVLRGFVLGSGSWVQVRVEGVQVRVEGVVQVRVEGVVQVRGIWFRFVLRGFRVWG
jgi:hypothetical protein